MMKPIPPGPKRPCPDCKAKAGEWCVVLPGNIPWQHAARPEDN